MYWVKTPRILALLFPNLIKVPDSGEKTLYLTFDDGPEPGVTDKVLEILSDFKAQATFFCLGKKVEEHPKIGKEIVAQGHEIGNHTFSHLNGWRTPTALFMQDVSRAEEAIRWNLGTKTRLFRAPYGRLRPGAWTRLKKKYSIIGWDIMPGDFDPKVSKEKCLENMIKNAENGSIIVLHDSQKSWEKLQYCLPKFLEHFTTQGYKFKALEGQNRIRQSGKVPPSKKRVSEKVTQI